MRTLSTVLGSLLLFGMASSGCWFLEDHCADLDPIEMEGSLEDFTTPFGAHDGVFLHGPAYCDEYSRYRKGHRLILEGLGDSLWETRRYAEDGCPSPDDSDCWVERGVFESAVFAELEIAGIEAGPIYGDVCLDQVEIDGFCRVYMHDWRQADLAVEILMEQMRLSDLGESVVLLVGPDSPYCE